MPFQKRFVFHFFTSFFRNSFISRPTHIHVHTYFSKFFKIKTERSCESRQCTTRISVVGSLMVIVLKLTVIFSIRKIPKTFPLLLCKKTVTGNPTKRSVGESLILLTFASPFFFLISVFSEFSEVWLHVVVVNIPSSTSFSFLLQHFPNTDSRDLCVLRRVLT